MNEFMQQLAAIRSKVGKLPGAAAGAAKGAVGRMRAQDEAMLASERARNDAMIRENFGTPENYARIQAEAPLPPTPGEYLGRGLKAAGNGLEDLFARLLAARGR